MLATDSQTLHDLEFNVITEWLENFCIGKTAQSKIRKLSPTSNFTKLEFELKQLDELRQIRVVSDTLPAIDFEELEEDTKKAVKVDSKSVPKFLDATTKIREFV
jgi:dsDNA-specific endonuclease/ATPase MutS2